jgi:hypothetical protein
MLYYEGQKRDFQLTVVIGNGLPVNGKLLYYDARGESYTHEQIAALKGKKVAIGTCARQLESIVDRFVDGCMPFPNSPHMVIHQMSHTNCRVVSLRNRYLFPALVSTIRACEKRKALLKSGQRIDIPLHHEDKCYATREFSEAESKLEYILDPFPPLTRAEIRQLCAAENRNILATFLP